MVKTIQINVLFIYIIIQDTYYIKNSVLHIIFGVGIRTTLVSMLSHIMPHVQCPLEELSCTYSSFISSMFGTCDLIFLLPLSLVIALW